MSPGKQKRRGMIAGSSAWFSVACSPVYSNCLWFDGEGWLLDDRTVDAWEARVRRLVFVLPCGV